MNAVTMKEVLSVALVAFLFIFAAYLSGVYKEELQDIFLLKGISGMALYVLVTVAAVVLAPISTLPLLPVAAAIWGSFLAAILSIAGWAIGAVIAFVIAKHLGRPLVSKFVNLEKADKISDLLAGKNPFWTVVFLRMVVPVDILSYAIGLFYPMPLFTYTLATTVGIIPFAFVFSYAAGLSLAYQMWALMLAAIAVFIGYRRINRAKIIDVGHR